MAEMPKTIGDSFKLIEWFVFQHRVPNLYKGNEMKAVIILDFQHNWSYITFFIFSLPHSFSNHHFAPIIFRFNYVGELIQ